MQFISPPIEARDFLLGQVKEGRSSIFMKLIKLNKVERRGSQTEAL